MRTVNAAVPTAVEVVPSGPVNARVVVPSSKSATNRALVIAALCEGESVLRSPLVSEDTMRMAAALRALGADVKTGDDAWVVRGTGGRLRAPETAVDCGASGTTMRFLTAVAALADGDVTLTGDGSLRRRPVGGLVDAMRALGVDVRATDDGTPPVTVRGGPLRGGPVEIDAAASSQFVSAVMLAAPFAREDVVIAAKDLGAEGYVEMTAHLMHEWGALAERDGEHGWRIRSGSVYEARAYAIEYDASAAAQVLAFAMTTGGTVSVPNASPTSQPDARITALFTAMGAGVSHEDGVSVTGPAVLRPLEASLALMPDQVATIAVCAALADGRSDLHDLAVVRGHETDRLAAVATELRALGVAVEERADALVIDGGAPRAARVSTYRDHRMAMAFAALGARVAGIVIAEPACVAKTYPDFWEDIRRAGVLWRSADG